MQKSILLTVAMLFGTLVFLQAQIEIKGTLGINAQRYDNEPQDFSQSARIGYNFGGSLQIGKKFYVEPGIFWQKMGSELVHKDQSDLDFKTDINSIRIPAFVGYQIIGGDKENIFGVRVFGGPTAAFVTSISSDGTDLDKEDFNNLIWGVDVGAGVDLWLLFLDVGYEWGLTPVFKNDPNDAKNRMWWSNVGIRIRI